MSLGCHGRGHPAALPVSPPPLPGTLPRAGCSNPPRRSCRSSWWAPAPSPFSVGRREPVSERGGGQPAGTPTPCPAPKPDPGCCTDTPKPSTGDTQRVGGGLPSAPPKLPTLRGLRPLWRHPGDAQEVGAHLCPPPGTLPPLWDLTQRTAPPQKKAPGTHLDSPYLDARRGDVQLLGDLGAELHHGAGCCRQGDLRGAASTLVSGRASLRGWAH